MAASLWRSFYQADLAAFCSTLSSRQRVLDDLMLSNARRGHEALEKSGILCSCPASDQSTALPKTPKTGPRPDGLMDLNWQDDDGYTLLHHIAFSDSAESACFAFALLSCPTVDIYVQSKQLKWTALHLALGKSNLAVAQAIRLRETRELLNIPIYKSVSRASGEATTVLRLARTLDEVEAYMGITPFETLPFDPSLVVDRDNLKQDVPAAGESSRNSENGNPNEGGGNSGDEDDDQLHPVASSAGQPRSARSVIMGIGSGKNHTLGFGDDGHRSKPQQIPFERPARALRHHQKPSNIRRKRVAPAGGDDGDVEEADSTLLDECDSNGSDPDVAEPARTGLCSPISIVDVRVSNLHSAVLTDDPCANLYLCGHGQGGRLGFGDEQTRLKFDCLDAGELGSVRVASVALGGNHSLAITDQGRLFGWGSNEFGQLGLKMPRDPGSSPVQLTPRSLAPNRFQGRPVVMAAASSVHSIVVTDDGKVFTFGKNNGQLGFGVAVSEPVHLYPRLVSTHMFARNSRVAHLAAADDCSVVVLDTGAVWLFSRYSVQLIKLLDSPMGTADRAVVSVAAKAGVVCFALRSGSIFVTEQSLGEHPADDGGGNTRAHCIYKPQTSGKRACSVDTGDHGAVFFTSAAGMVWKLSRGKRAGRPDDPYELSLVTALETAVLVRANSAGSVIVVGQSNGEESRQGEKYRDGHGIAGATDCPVPIPTTTSSPTGRASEVPAFLFPGQSFYADLWSVFPLANSTFCPPPALLSARPSSFARPPSHADFLAHRSLFVSTLRALIRSKSSNVDEVIQQTTYHNPVRGSMVSFRSRVSGVAIPVHRFIVLAGLARLSSAVQQAELTGATTRIHSVTVSPSISSGTLFESASPSCEIEFDCLNSAGLLHLIFYLYTDQLRLGTCSLDTELDPRLGLEPTDEPVKHGPILDSELVVKNLVSDLGRSDSMATLSDSICAFCQMARIDLSQAGRVDPSDQERQLFADADVVVKLDGGKGSMKLHSAILLARCGPLAPLFSSVSADHWSPSSRATTRAGAPITQIDMTHVSSGMFYLLRYHLYTGVTDRRLFSTVVAGDDDQLIDFVLGLAVLADEMVIDPLAHGCHLILLNLTTVRNVCLIYNRLRGAAVETYRAGAVEFAVRHRHSILAYPSTVDVIPLFDQVRLSARPTDDVVDFRVAVAREIGGEDVVSSVSRPDGPVVMAQLHWAETAAAATRLRKSQERRQSPGRPNEVAKPVPVLPSASSVSPLAARFVPADSASVGKPGAVKGKEAAARQARLDPVSCPPARGDATPSSSRRPAMATPGRPAGMPCPKPETGKEPVVLDMRGTAALPPSGRSRHLVDGLARLPTQAQLEDYIKPVTPPRFVRFPKTGGRSGPSSSRQSPASEGRLDGLSERPSARMKSAKTEELDSGSLERNGQTGESWSSISALDSQRKTGKPKGGPITTKSEASKVVYSAQENHAAQGRAGPNVSVITNVHITVSGNGTTTTTKTTTTTVEPPSAIVIDPAATGGQDPSVGSVFSIQHQPPPKASLYFSPIVDPTPDMLMLGKIGGPGSGKRAGGGNGSTSTRKSRRAANSKMPTPNIQDIIAEEEFEHWWEAECRRIQAEDDASLAVALALLEEEDKNVGPAARRKRNRRRRIRPVAAGPPTAPARQ